MVPVRTLIFITLMALTAGADARRPHGPRAQAGQFDYYAVALSWSPAYCASHRDAAECQRRLGFVLHGVWPQYANGYPESCGTERLPGDVRVKYGTLFPAPGLIDHEWSKHGTCSGLDPASYFALVASLKGKVAIPGAFDHPTAPVRTTNRDFAQAFQAANPGLAPDAVLPFCGGGGRFLREIHVCYDKRGGSLSCSASEIKRSSNSCRKDSFMLQNVR